MFAWIMPGLEVPPRYVLDFPLPKPSVSLQMILSVHPIKLLWLIFTIQEPMRQHLILASARGTSVKMRLFVSRIDPWLLPKWQTLDVAKHCWVPVVSTALEPGRHPREMERLAPSSHWAALSDVKFQAKPLRCSCAQILAKALPWAYVWGSSPQTSGTQASRAFQGPTKRFEIWNIQKVLKYKVPAEQSKLTSTKYNLIRLWILDSNVTC